jgi:hypothetical protein
LVYILDFVSKVRPFSGNNRPTVGKKSLKTGKRCLGGGKNQTPFTDEMGAFLLILVDFHQTKIVTTTDDKVVRVIIYFLVLMLFHY